MHRESSYAAVYLTTMLTFSDIGLLRLCHWSLSSSASIGKLLWHTGDLRRATDHLSTGQQVHSYSTESPEIPVLPCPGPGRSMNVSSEIPAQCQDTHRHAGWQTSEVATNSLLDRLCAAVLE